MTPLTAFSLTPAARDWLLHTTSARVLNSFDRACNLINQDDAILALVTSERGLTPNYSIRGLTPFAMAVASAEQAPFRAVSEASVVRVEGNRLIVGSLQIEVGSAQLWNPIPGWAAVRRLFAGDSELLEALAAMAIEAAPGGSLLELFSHLEKPDRLLETRQVFPASRLIFERAREGALRLNDGLRAGSLEQCLAGVKQLAGLGGGLTPAGDDFIVGALLAAWAGLYGEGREQLGIAIAGAAAPLTTTLSAAYLRSAARGECAAHWHVLFESLLRSDAGATQMAIRSLAAIGHTSGADALAGFLSFPGLHLTGF